MAWPESSTANPVNILILLEQHANGFNLPQISGAMDRAFDQSGPHGSELVSTVEGYIAKIASYDVQIDAKAANANLIKADVLAWSDGGSNGSLGGLMGQREIILNRLAAVLGLTPSTGCGGRVRRA